MKSTVPSIANPPTAVQLVLETKQELVDDRAELSRILSKCLSISSVLGMKSDSEWISLELYGYYEKFRTEGEGTNSLPLYRRAKCEYYDADGMKIPTPRDLGFIEEIPIGLPIAEVEQKSETGITIDGSRLQLLRKELQFPAYSGIVPPAKIEMILTSVKARISDFLDRAVNLYRD